MHARGGGSRAEEGRAVLARAPRAASRRRGSAAARAWRRRRRAARAAGVVRVRWVVGGVAHAWFVHAGRRRARPTSERTRNSTCTEAFPSASGTHTCPRIFNARMGSSSPPPSCSMTGGAVRRPSSHVVASLPCPRVGVTLPGVHGADVVCSRGCVRSRTTALDHPRSGHAPRCADGRRGSFVPPKPLRLLQVVLRTLSRRTSELGSSSSRAGVTDPP